MSALPDYWITTHWPVPEFETDFSRHVYVKDRHIKVPKAGDVVLVRESISVRGEISPTVERHHLGQRKSVKLPAGYGGIIGKMLVEGIHRPITDTDIVYNYGDLQEWSIITCHNFQSVHLSLNDLMVAIGKVPETTPRFLDLYRVPDKHVRDLMRRFAD